MWLLLALTTAVFWAIGSVIVKKGLNDLPVRIVYVANALVYASLWIVYLMIFGGFSWQPVAGILALSVGLGAIYTLTAFKKADVSLVSSIGSIHPAVTAILAVSFLKESLTWLQMALIGLVVVGAMIMGWPHSAKSFVRDKLGAWIWWGLGFGLLSGTINFISKFGISLAGAVSYSLLSAFWQVVIGLTWLKKDRAFEEIKPMVTKKKGRVVVLGTVALNVGNMMFFTAMGLGKVSLVMPVANLFVPLTIILAAWWLKEKMTKQQMLGAGVILGSVILLSLIS